MAKVKHIALFKFKEEISVEKIDETFDQILDVSESVDGIEDYVSGPNNSPEGLNQGCSHGFVMTFENVEKRDAFLQHAEHERLKQLMADKVDLTIIFDFEVA